MSLIKFPKKEVKSVIEHHAQNTGNPVILYPDETMMIPHGPFMVTNIHNMGHFCQLIINGGETNA